MSQRNLQFEHGFADYVLTHPEVGFPTTPEYPIKFPDSSYSTSYNVQETSTGLLVYSIHTNEIDFANFSPSTENPPPPNSNSLLEVIDVSNHQSWANHPETARAYLDSLNPTPTRAIVRLASYLEPVQLRTIAINQLQTFAALAPQIDSIQAYIWCYANANPITEMDYANNQVIESQIPYLDTIWQDHEEYEGEPGPSTEWAIKAADYLTKQLGYQTCGIYTGKYYWDDHHAYGLPSLPLWVAAYNPYYNIDTVPLPNGWTQAAGWQYTDTPVDRSVFRS